MLMVGCDCLPKYVLLYPVRLLKWFFKMALIFWFVKFCLKKGKKFPLTVMKNCLGSKISYILVHWAPSLWGSAPAPTAVTMFPAEGRLWRNVNSKFLKIQSTASKERTMKSSYLVPLHLYILRKAFRERTRRAHGPKLFHHYCYRRWILHP